MAEAALVKSAPTVLELAKYFGRRVSSWRDRSAGLKMLKSLPQSMEAEVFGEDFNPELLAALSLGGTPGLHLSTIALLTFLDKDGGGGGGPAARGAAKDGVSSSSAARGAEKEEEEEKLPTLPANLSLVRRWLGKPSAGIGRATNICHVRFRFVDPALRDLYRPFTWHVSRHDASIRLAENELVRVMAYAADPDEFTDGVQLDGLVVEQGGSFYYCEHRDGHFCLSPMEFSSGSFVTIRHEGSMTTSLLMESSKVVVAPSFIKNRQDFLNLLRLLEMNDDDVIVGLLGLQKTAETLRNTFVELSGKDVGRGISLLSIQHLQNLHSGVSTVNLGRMPTGAHLLSKLEKVRKDLSILDRDVGLILGIFRDIQETIADFVVQVETKAAERGNVGVRPYTRTEGSALIEDAIVQSASAKQSEIVVFQGFKKSMLNVIVSPGCTAVYFPGLGITVTFPEGYDKEGKKQPCFLKPACPFTSDYQETLRILVELADKLAVGSVKGFAKVLSSELASNPALVVSPLTTKVVGELMKQGKHQKFSFADLFSHVDDSINPASVAGVLFQLGLKYSGDQGPRSFFDLCRKIWQPRAAWGELVVDFAVDLSSCDVVREHRKRRRDRLLLKAAEENLAYELTGKVADVPWEELSKYNLSGLDVSLRKVASSRSDSGDPVRLPVPCYLVGLLEEEQKMDEYEEDATEDDEDDEYALDDEDDEYALPRG